MSCASTVLGLTPFVSPVAAIRRSTSTTAQILEMRPLLLVIYKARATTLSFLDVERYVSCVSLFHIILLEYMFLLYHFISSQTSWVARFCERRFSQIPQTPSVSCFLKPFFLSLPPQKKN